jgi:hypothetical protein
MPIIAHNFLFLHRVNIFFIPQQAEEDHYEDDNSIDEVHSDDDFDEYEYDDDDDDDHDESDSSEPPSTDDYDVDVSVCTRIVDMKYRIIK